MCCDTTGGCDCVGCYSTPMNTIGVGNVIPATSTTLGSGDIMMGIGTKPKQKKQTPTPKKTNNGSPYNLQPPLIVYSK